jgi:rhodanese-related sulfurtransferase
VKERVGGVLVSNAINLDKLHSDMAGPNPPRVVDVRKDAAYVASGMIIAGAVRIKPEDIADSADRFHGETAVVYCVHGHEVSQGACEALREAGVEAFYLEGGFDAWAKAGYPLWEQNR